MTAYLEAASEVLRHTRCRLTTREMTYAALQRGLVPPSARRPTEACRRVCISRCVITRTDPSSASQRKGAVARSPCVLFSDIVTPCSSATSWPVGRHCRSPELPASRGDTMWLNRGSADVAEPHTRSRRPRRGRAAPARGRPPQRHDRRGPGPAVRPRTCPAAFSDCVAARCRARASWLPAARGDSRERETDKPPIAKLRA
jgi:hypothetical protein